MSRYFFYLCFLFFYFNLVSQPLIQKSEYLTIDIQELKSLIDSRDELKQIRLSSNPNFTFLIKENGVLEGPFKNENPEIKTYFIYKDNSTVGSFTYSPSGIWAYYNINGNNISISPNWNSVDRNSHKVKYGVQPSLKGTCGVDDKGKAIDFATFRKLTKNRADFTDKLEYKIAIVATGEFTVANGGTVPSAKAAIAASVNGISEMYQKQMGIFFNLVSSFAYVNPSTDPFIPDNSGGQSRTTQAGIQVPAAFPGANNTYHIGHVVHTHNDGSDGWSNGGLAQLQSVCDNGSFGGALNKASGWSGSFSNDDFGWLNLFAHEVGHQFGMTHTFNGTGGSCTDNISEISAVEIGSGTTIMSYNGLCQDNNNVPASGALDGYFHYFSVGQAAEYLLGLALSGVTCASPTPTTNHHPEGTANPCGVPVYNLPKGTAFYLKGEATDEDGDPLYYAWDQFDEDGPGTPTQGNIGGSAASKKKSPLFKNIPPNLVNERYFPDIITVSKGLTSDPFQVLPTTNRDINIAFSARDNKAIPGGGIYYEEILINVATSGPLTVADADIKDTLLPGETFDVKWLTNGSDLLCSNAAISLSLDGGITFPVMLASNVPYSSQTHSVTLPKTLNLNTTARLKVECVDYDCYKFYDISNNIRIESNCSAPGSIICPSNNLSFDKGDPALDLNLEFKAGLTETGFSKRITENNNNLGRVIMYNSTKTGCADVSNYYRTSTIVSVDKTGLYTFVVDRDFADGTGFITIVNNETWNPSSPCASGFIGSSAYETGSGGFVNEEFFQVTLQECVDYRILFYNFPDQFPINTVVTSITGPGNLIEQYSSPQSNYTYTFIAVRNSDQIIVAHSPLADFTSLNGGNYTIYGIYYKTSGPTPPNNTDISNYIGKEFREFLITDDCFVESYNSFQLEVISDCSVTGVTLGNKGNCNQADNTFTQEIIVTYEGTPTGKISANGVLYDITTSPQTIIYTGLSDGMTRNIEVFIDSESDCKNIVTIEAPENCCPFDIGISKDVSGCTGQPLVLTANNNLGTYEWTTIAGTVFDTDNEATITIAGQYFIEVTSSTGCSKQQEINVVFEQTPSISLPADVTICEGVEFVINATTLSGNITWYKDGDIVQVGSNKNLLVDKSGVYRAVVGSGLCEADDEIVISTKPSPNPTLGIDKNICEGSSTTLNVANEGTIQWFYNNNLIAGQSSTSLTVTQDGIYKVVVTGSNNCQKEDEINVNVFSLPVVDAGDDLSYCKNSTVTIDATSSSIIFEWYKNDNPISQANLSFIVNSPGEYKIVAFNQNNISCKASDSLIVTENPLPVANLGSEKVACIGSEVKLKNSVTTGLMFEWSRGAVSLGTTEEITVTTSGTYTLLVTDNNGCTNVDDVNVIFQAGPTVSLNEVTIEICEGQSFDVIATTTATKIVWIRDNVVIPNQTSKTLKVTQAGNYKILATGSLQGGAECTAEEEFMVTVNPVLNVSVNDTTVCEGETVTISSNVNAQKYTWLLDNNVVGNTKTYKPTVAGKYILEVETNKGCKSSDEINVTFSPRPGIGLDPTGQFCEGDDFTINAQTNGTSFKWFRNNILIPNETLKMLTVDQAGTYVFESSYNGACPKKDTIIISKRPLPIVALGQNTTLCPNQTITLDAKNTGSKYKWSTGDTTQQIVLNNNTGIAQIKTIIAEVTNQFNCKSSDDITITYRPKVVASVTASATGICNGDSIILLAKGGIDYTWSGPQGTFDILDKDSILVYPKENSIYTVIASDDCPGNRDTINKEVKFFEIKPASAGKDTCVITGRSIKLKATGGVKYLWKSDESITAGANTSSPTVAPTVETTYTVSITDANGCQQVDSIVVCIIEDPLKLIIPVEYITPNGDGFNDKLEFIGLEAFPDNSLIVYNRWGNVVFEKYRYQQDTELFDGTRNGELLPPDTYYYVLKFDEYVFKQALTIVREK